MCNFRRHASLLALLLLLGTVIFQNLAISQQVQPSSFARTGKISIVFDGSASMCGYLHSGVDTTENDLIIFARKAASYAENGKAKVFILAQKNVGYNVPQDDFYPVGVNLFSAITTVAKNKTDGCMVPDKKYCLITSFEGNKGRCKLFPGKDSSMNLIFSPAAPTAKSDTIILVTDALFENDAREDFSRQYQKWAESSGVAISDMNAGYSVSNPKFFGTYYPVDDRSAINKGYNLSLHHRPLVVMWFTRNREHLSIIRDMVGYVEPPKSIKTPNLNARRSSVSGVEEFLLWFKNHIPFMKGTSKATESPAQLAVNKKNDSKILPPASSPELTKPIVHTLLPIVDTSGAATITNVNLPSNYMELFDRNKFIIASPGKKLRSDDNLQSCFESGFDGDKGIYIRAAKKCKDNLPLFLGVSRYTAKLKPKYFGSMKVRFSKDDGQNFSDDLSIDITPEAMKNAHETTVKLRVEINDKIINGKTGIMPRSLDSDDCRRFSDIAEKNVNGEKNSRNKMENPLSKIDLNKCREYVDYKTFRLDAFSDAMISRSNEIISKELEKITNINYVLRIGI